MKLSDRIKQVSNESIVIKKVVRQGKIKKVKTCSDGQHMSNGRCVPNSGTWLKMQKMAAKKRKKSKRGKSLGPAIKKRARSMMKAIHQKTSSPIEK